MKVLVTGAWGTIGSRVVIELLARGHQVRALDLGSWKNHRRANRLSSKAQRLWGDIRSRSTTSTAVANMDGIVHLAAVLPPPAYEAPAYARSVNLGGSQAIIEAAVATGRNINLVYASSAAVYGVTQMREPPVRPDQPAVATDDYTADKLRTEQLIRQQPFAWTIVRLSHVPILGLRTPHRVMFDIPLDNRMELLHADDAALALVNTLESEACRRQTLLVAGGETCRTIYKDYLERALAAMGLTLPRQCVFGSEYHYTDWLDTAESQRMLRYQRHSFADIMNAIAGAGRRWQPVVRAFAPLIARLLVHASRVTQAQRSARQRALSHASPPTGS